MTTPIADKFYHDAKDAPVERLGQIVGQAYSTIETLERERAELIEALRPFAKFACDAQPETCGCNNCRAAALIAKHAAKVAP